jgi:predicted metal-dependent phosphoesterase TrpH
VIDLHTHTTASDGRCTPAELVRGAAAAGVTVLGVTDHDTIGGCDAASAACADARIEFVAGIEITAVREAADVHVLGYFIDTRSAALQAFLSRHRATRIDRVRQMIDRLAQLGIALDADAILAPGIADSAKAAGRPWIARALVAAGHASSTDEAFDRWLSRGRPAFVPRAGASPEEVFGRIHDAGGVASLAHPALVGHDEWIDGFASAGLDALEVYHTDHDDAAVARYAAAARRLGLAVTGGSDFHGDATHGAVTPGIVSLPRDEYDALKARSRGLR